MDLRALTIDVLPTSLDALESSPAAYFNYEFGYDGLGRRVWTQGYAGDGSWFIYDGDQLVQERNFRSDARVVEYAWGPTATGGPAIFYQNRKGINEDGSDQERWIYTSPQGHFPRHLFDDTGTITDTFQYSSFGELVFHEGSTEVDFGWQRNMVFAAATEKSLLLWKYSGLSYLPGLASFAPGPMGAGDSIGGIDPGFRRPDGTPFDPPPLDPNGPLPPGWKYCITDFCSPPPFPVCLLALCVKNCSLENCCDPDRIKIDPKCGSGFTGGLFGDVTHVNALKCYSGAPRVEVGGGVDPYFRFNSTYTCLNAARRAAKWICDNRYAAVTACAGGLATRLGRCVYDSVDCTRGQEKFKSVNIACVCMPQASGSHFGCTGCTSGSYGTSPVIIFNRCKQNANFGPTIFHELLHACQCKDRVSTLASGPSPLQGDLWSLMQACRAYACLGSKSCLNFTGATGLIGMAQTNHKGSCDCLEKHCDKAADGSSCVSKSCINGVSCKSECC